MATTLEPRNNGLSCVYDAFVHSLEAGLLEPAAEEIIHRLPDEFPMRSIQQLCSTLNADLHVNCISIVPPDEQLINLFADEDTIDGRGVITAHAEFLHWKDISSYLNTRSNLQFIGFVAFRGIECIPIQDVPERYHIPINIRTLGMPKVL